MKRKQIAHKKKKQSIKPTIKPFRFTIISLDDDERSKWIKIANKTINTGKEKIKDFEYLFFYFGGDDLRGYPIAKDSKGSVNLIPYKGLKKIDPSIESIMTEDIPQICGYGLKNSWEIYYRHWSMSDFILYLSGESYFLSDQNRNIEEVLKLRTRKEELKDRFKDIRNNRPVMPILDSQSFDERYYSDYRTNSEIAILKAIVDDPMLLYNTKIMNKFRDILVPILVTARWNLDRKKREWTKDLLSKHLIPKHPGGKKPLVTGIKYKLAIELMEKFAEHLSEKCTGYQIAMAVDPKSKIGKEAYADLNLLKDFAWQNKDRRLSDGDIATMDIDDLKVLIKSPHKFVQRFIKTNFNIKTPKKTLS